MNTEERFLIEILKDFIAGETTNCIEGIDWVTLLHYSKIHQILGIVYHQCKSFAPFDADIKRQVISTVAYGVQVNNVICHFSNVLHDYHYVFFKGAVVSSLYPLPEYRTMSDVDVLIPISELDKIHEVLLSEGFSYIGREPHPDGTHKYSIQGVQFELHTHLMHPEMKRDKMYNFFEEAWKYANQYAFSDEFHFILLVAHVKEHFLGSSIGFRQFLDIAFYIEKRELDWKEIKNFAEEAGLLRFLQCILEILHTWFGIQTRMESHSLDDRVIEQLTDKVYYGGVFGNDDHSNEVNSTINVIRHTGRLGGLVKLIRDAFPPYEEMLALNGYGILKRSRMFLPYAWLIRIIRKLSKWKKIQHRYFVSSKEVEERIELLDTLGL